MDDHEVGELLGEEKPRIPDVECPKTRNIVAATAPAQLTGWRKWALIVAAGALAAGASICISKSKVHGTQLYNPVTCTQR